LRDKNRTELHADEKSRHQLWPSLSGSCVSIRGPSTRPSSLIIVAVGDGDVMNTAAAVLVGSTPGIHIISVPHTSVGCTTAVQLVWSPLNILNTDCPKGSSSPTNRSVWCVGARRDTCCCASQTRRHPPLLRDARARVSAMYRIIFSATMVV
jgi:hypothetical protein